MYKMLFCKKKEEKVLNYKPIFSGLRMYFYQWYLIWSDGCLLHLKFWCLLLTFWLKQLCSLKPVSILRAKEGNHKMQKLYFSTFWALFLKSFIFEVAKFYLNKYQISNQINFFSGSLYPCQFIQNLWIISPLSHRFFWSFHQCQVS